MRFTIATVALAALSFTALAHPAPETSSNPTMTSLTQRDSIGNCNGCNACNLSNTFIGNCRDAVNQFIDDVNYASQQRFTVGDCYADWWCNGAYPVKAGRDIKNVFKVGIWQKAGCKACGEWWLDDGSNCHGTVQARGC